MDKYSVIEDIVLHDNNNLDGLDKLRLIKLYLLHWTTEEEVYQVIRYKREENEVEVNEQ